MNLIFVEDEITLQFDIYPFIVDSIFTMQCRLHCSFLGNANFVCIVWRPWETEALQLKLRSLSLRGRWGDIWGRADHDHGQFGFVVSHQVLDVRL